MEPTTRRTPTSSGDGPVSWTNSENIPAAPANARGTEREGADLLRADGSLIPVTRADEADDEASRREPLHLPSWRAGARLWWSRTVDRAAERLSSAAPSEIALSAFAAGLVTGVILGVASASARR